VNFIPCFTSDSTFFTICYDNFASDNISSFFILESHFVWFIVLVARESCKKK